MKKIKVAVTGSRGFLGGHVIERLRKHKNISVYSFDRQRHNLLRIKSLEDFLSKKDVIIHLAAVNKDSNANFIKVNTLGVLGLLEGICKYSPGAKLIFASSFQAYDKKSLYGLSKKFAEEIIRLYAKKNNIKSIILRISNIYGPGGKPFYNSVIATFIHQLKKTLPIVINGNGKQKRDYIYIDDAVDAIIKCISYIPSSNVTSVDICSGTLTSINDIVSTLKRVSTRNVRTIYNKSFHGALGNIEKKRNFTYAKRLLSWKPTISLTTGLTSMLKDNEA